MKFLQDMQLIQKLQDDQKRMKKVVEDMSRSYVQKSNQDRVRYRKLLCHPQQYVRLQAEEIKLKDSSRSRSLKTISRNAGLHSYNFTIFLLVGNIVTNLRVTRSWGRLLASLFSEAGVLHGSYRGHYKNKGKTPRSNTTELHFLFQTSLNG
uniref:Uncharacterized protein n=1 Tax=Tanacetum cinerariifolium TaxID=118510 RepID=A0A699IM91_TANCI|nr:hypothetical protein [Tanacetum cinerariifolium]